MKSFYKIVDLFGNEQKVVINKTNKKPDLFTDYDAFLDKFEDKKTTDDCYTPPEVYEIVINYVNEIYPLKDKKIIRPFFPGGDYESVEYTEDMVVIDNPPFSIISKICKYYISNKINFFLFAPHMTAFGSDIDATHIIISQDIIYENGAKVKTSFVSNLYGDLKIIGDYELHSKLKELEQRNKENLPKYVYPSNILTVSKIAYCVDKGISIKINKKDVKHYRQMDDQKNHKKAIFGNGFIVSNHAAALVTAATAAAEAAAKAAEKENVIFWELSDREKKIIESLGICDCEPHTFYEWEKDQNKCCVCNKRVY